MTGMVSTLATIWRLAIPYFRGEDRWRARFGAGTIAALRRPLEELVLGADGRPPLLFQGLEPYPDNWRASVRPPRTLPYYPMVLHRGGYPDGS